MLAEGVLDAAGKRVSSAYGMHVASSLFPRGVFSTRPGPMLAASDGLYVTVRGSGGHGSMPHLARDPIVVAAQMVGDLQTLITHGTLMYLIPSWSLWAPFTLAPSATSFRTRRYSRRQSALFP